MSPGKRTYERTHPWITFRLDVRPMPFKAWVGVGLAEGLTEQIRDVPMLPKAATELHLVYLTRGVLATTAIEGNTLSEEQVRGIVRGEVQLPPSLRYQQHEIENILTAYNEVLKRLARGELTIDGAFFKEMNALILDGLEREPGVVPGELRTGEVAVGGGVYHGAPASDCGFLLDRLASWLAEPWFGDDPFIDGLAKAIIGHLYIAWIHPFGDGNGRTARLLELALLLRLGVPAPAGHVLSNHYNMTRPMYYRRLAEASRTKNGELGFLAYAVEGFVDGLRSQLKTVLAQHRDLVWQRLVTEAFGEELTRAGMRQRSVALALPEAFIQRGAVPGLSPAIARAYLDRGMKTVTRDLNKLESLGLVSLTSSRVRARRELVDHLKPFVRPDEA